jgi:N-acetylmuramoyl-L-alanine amidase
LSGPAVLRPGSSGEAVRDLQRRLGAQGHAIPNEELGRFGDATTTAVTAFQAARGLRVDGVCGRETWAALVESGYELGDRLLYRRRPMVRGDDVAELQRRLNAFGFDAGKEDGILGDDTAGALAEFQRNVGVSADGICGPDTIAAFGRLARPPLEGIAEGAVASVREREALRRGEHRLAGRRVFVAASPGFEVLASGVVHGLLTAGADAILAITGSAGSDAAAEANRYAADLFLAVRPGDTPGCHCAYYESGRFRSETGYRVARAIAAGLGELLDAPPATCGRTYAVLRETRMPAVICEPCAAGDVDAVRRVVRLGGEVAHAIVRGVRLGVGEVGAGEQVPTESPASDS